ncbi:thioredoxin [Petroclostridium sp. X23]|jgi:thioredoxin 1|uniref:thioredoxin n=1 Tax=Petroclostridium sp. X23 TaxID=3045146 RepID=UPI0024ACAEB4|nr:thioredoxin [Petroclostridium sp. X23]WHH60728.1 thioredoxin [Petroclostridium sp. X23]
MASEKVLTITNDNFQQEVKDSSAPVLVDFWASWCGPCRMVAPVIDELANDFEGKAKIGKVNVDEQRDIASQYRVMSIPTIMLFKNGEVVDKVVGVRSKEDFAAMIERNL